MPESDGKKLEASAENIAAEKQPPVRVRFLETGSGLKCVFWNRLDSETVGTLEAELKARIDKASGKRIVYELAAVDYVASAFLRLCVFAAKKSAGNFAILNPTPEVRRILRVAGLENLARGDKSELP